MARQAFVRDEQKALKALAHGTNIEPVECSI
jgi:hypothetical protein